MKRNFKNALILRFSCSAPAPYFETLWSTTKIPCHFTAMQLITSWWGTCSPFNSSNCSKEATNSRTTCVINKAEIKYCMGMPESANSCLQCYYISLQALSMPITYIFHVWIILSKLASLPFILAFFLRINFRLLFNRLRRTTGLILQEPIRKEHQDRPVLVCSFAELAYFEHIGLNNDFSLMWTCIW